MANWPNTLPALSVGDYTSTTQDRTLRSEMDAGPAKARPRFTAGSEYIAGTLKCTPTQRDTLRTFFESTLQGGALTFYWNHPETGTSRRARFRRPPTYRPTTGKVLWLVSVDLEVLP